ncbi:MAG TPA: FtsW/RodA/SpoVE family cell cycle protein [Mycobacteriales bacterium]|nr:FtsW/RodA/SpoVE family cell cycle protein [Mycobacteriales bacterium]
MTAATAHPAAAPPKAAPKRRPTRRNTELALVLAASAIVWALSVAIEAAVQRDITPASSTLPAFLAVVFVGAHLAVRFLAPYADPVILPCAALLNGIGVIFIRRLDLGEIEPGQRVAFDAFRGEGIRQVQWTVVAILALVALLYLLSDHRTLSRYAYSAGLFGVVFIAIPAVLPSSLSEVNGAKIWIIIPGLFSVQPGEFAKLALMVFYASYLVTKRDVLSLASKRVAGIDFPRGRDLGPVLVVWAASLMVLMFERDLGTSLMYFGIFVVMLYIATQRTSWLLIGLGLFFGGALLAWQVVSRVQLRVDIWLHPFADANGRGFQIVQSLFGLGTGGLFGTGPGAGAPNGVPYASTDFITATIGEETGLFGLTGVLILYLLISARGMRAALDVRDSFGKLLAGGLAFSVSLQVFVIVGGVSKLIPLTGLTTPFLSYGGSSLLANWLLVALLLRISDAGRRPAVPSAPPVQLRSAPTEVVKL